MVILFNTGHFLMFLQHIVVILSFLMDSWIIVISNNVGTRMANCFCAYERDILVFISQVAILAKQRAKWTPKQHSSQWLSYSSSREYIHYFISCTTWKSVNCDENDDVHTSTPCITRSVYVLLVKPQSNADDVTNALRDAIIVTRAHEKWYLTR